MWPPAPLGALQAQSHLAPEPCFGSASAVVARPHTPIQSIVAKNGSRGMQLSIEIEKLTASSAKYNTGCKWNSMSIEVA
jgi:hypothetical protein